TFIQNNDNETSLQIKNNNSSKGSNACSNCNETSHNIWRCTALCKLYKKEGNTYVRCSYSN
ncbi:hypothetical protein C2G38_2054050, partial [Gigaspora rosea]